MLQIVKHRAIWFTLSAILVGIAVISVAVWRFQESPEFKGGTLWEFSAVADNPPLASVQGFFTTNLNVPDAQVSYDAKDNLFIATFGRSTKRRTSSTFKSSRRNIRRFRN